MTSPFEEHSDSELKDERYLQSLAADYQSLRADFERLDQTGAALLAVAVTVAMASGAFLLNTCKNLPSLACTPRVWPSLYAFLPLVPFAAILLFADLGNAKTLRMYYTRTVEAELRRVGNAPEVSFADGYPIRLPAFGHIAVGVFGQHRGRPRYRLSVWVVYTTIAVLYFATTFLSLWVARPIDLQIGMAAFYASLTVLVFRVAWLGGTGARLLWKDATRPVSWAIDSTGQPKLQSNTAMGESRSIARYLILPRPHELLVRFWIIPAAWTVATLSADEPLTGWALVHILIATAVYEYLFYQARYIVNDLRGISGDSKYSSYKRRNRFPFPARPSWVKAAVLVVALRALAGVYIAARLLPGSYAEVTLIGAAILATQASVYEILRTKVSPSAGKDLLSLTLGRSAIYVVVGLGYVVRAWVGLTAGGAGKESLFGLTLACIAMLFFGSMAVTVAWALSSVSQIVPPDGNWPTNRCTPVLLTMTHLGPLARQARLLRRESGALVILGNGGWLPNEYERVQNVRFLASISSMTWWNVMAVGAAGTATATAISFGTFSSLRLILGGLLIGAVAELGVVLVSRTGTKSVAATCLGLTLLSVGLRVTTDTETTVASGLVWLVATLGYLSFRYATPKSVEVSFGDLTHALIAIVRPLVYRAFSAIFGEGATSLIQSRR